MNCAHCLPCKKFGKNKAKVAELKQIAPNASVLTSTSLGSDDTYDGETD